MTSFSLEVQLRMGGTCTVCLQSKKVKRESYQQDGSSNLGRNVMSSRMLHREIRRKSTYLSEEHVASIFSVKK
jgi:hypothetical protein